MPQRAESPMIGISTLRFFVRDSNPQPNGFGGVTGLRPVLLNHLAKHPLARIASPLIKHPLRVPRHEKVKKYEKIILNFEF